jgi:CRISPR-associated protein Cas2
MRFNEYRIVWIFIFFDLPTDTKQDRKNYTKFRKGMLKDGFSMFQFSIYIRHCASRENAMVHVNRVKRILPSKGYIGILQITDKQFGNMELFFGKNSKPSPDTPVQLELF